MYSTNSVVLDFPLRRKYFIFIGIASFPKPSISQEEKAKKVLGIYSLDCFYEFPSDGFAHLEESFFIRNSK
jgi:hypothetical protein